MASKLKAEVVLNAVEADIDLELTPHQASKLLELFYAGATATINLQTPKNGGNGRARFTEEYTQEDPKAYAE
jgi:hypothetical protein